MTDQVQQVIPVDPVTVASDTPAPQVVAPIPSQDPTLPVPPVPPEPTTPTVPPDLPTTPPIPVAAAADPLVANPTVTADEAAPAEEKKPERSPLEMLDQILNDAQAKSDQVAAEKEAAEKAALEAEIARRKIEDEQKIAAELAALQQVQFSPQSQARAEQDQEAAQKEEAYKAEMSGMEIHQLGHTKL